MFYFSSLFTNLGVSLDTHWKYKFKHLSSNLHALQVLTHFSKWLKEVWAPAVCNYNQKQEKQVKVGMKTGCLLKMISPKFIGNCGGTWSRPVCISSANFFFFWSRGQRLVGGLVSRCMPVEKWIPSCDPCSLSVDHLTHKQRPDLCHAFDHLTPWRRTSHLSLAFKNCSRVWRQESLVCFFLVECRNLTTRQIFLQLITLFFFFF